MFLDGDRESEDIDDVIDLLGLDESAKFGDWLPLDFFSLSFRSLTSLLVLVVSAKSSASFGLGSLCSWWWNWWSLLCHKIL